jgi:hypothetical protein
MCQRGCSYASRVEASVGDVVDNLGYRVGISKDKGIYGSVSLTYVLESRLSVFGLFSGCTP